MPGTPATTRRVMFTEPGVVRVEDAVVPSPGAGDVLIRTRCSLISQGTECATLLGPPWRRADGKLFPTYPCSSGYSNAGEIIAVGEAVEDYAVGDRVASAAAHTGIACLRPHQPRWRICRW